MIYGSVCSGIEAASVAWHPLGWRAAWFAEIDKFPSAVLKHHYPNTPNHGDFTKITESKPLDVLVGGTPCQDFSVAGLRAGMDGARGNLTLEFLKFAGRLRPRWLVWENVPGVLSIDDGRAFGAILGGMGLLGYGFAYRVLDAQYFGLAQRRKRVFVVGYFGDWRPAAAVLFDSACLSGNPPPSRETGEGITHDIAGSLTSSGRGVERGGDSRGQDPVVAMCLNAGAQRRIDAESETFITQGFNNTGQGWWNEAETAATVRKGNDAGFDASEDGTGRGTPLVAIPILEAGARTGKSTTDVRAGSGIGDPGDPMYTLQSGKQHAVRRLTPVECERLQGFPDGYTQVPYRGKASADGPRYKALGNSMAVPAMAWIGRRIQAVEGIAKPPRP